jgi:hypothetical protein
MGIGRTERNHLMKKKSNKVDLGPRRFRPNRRKVAARHNVPLEFKLLVLVACVFVIFTIMSR